MFQAKRIFKEIILFANILIFFFGQELLATPVKELTPQESQITQETLFNLGLIQNIQERFQFGHLKCISRNASNQVTCELSQNGRTIRVVDQGHLLRGSELNSLIRILNADLQLNPLCIHVRWLRCLSGGVCQIARDPLIDCH